MYEKFLKIKEKRPWLFYLLIVPFLVVFILEMYNKYLVNSGKEIVKDAEKEDKALKVEQDKAKAGADWHKDEADKIGDKIKNISVDDDWHLDD